MRRSENGGRSSATPDADADASPESRRSSPLHSAPDQPRRKRPAHFPTVEAGNRSIIIFLTICTNQRRPLLANDRAANLILEAWTAATFWCVGRYVILPEHIHLFCAPNTFPPEPLKNWIPFGKIT